MSNQSIITFNQAGEIESVSGLDEEMNRTNKAYIEVEANKAGVTPLEWVEKHLPNGVEIKTRKVEVVYGQRFLEENLKTDSNE